MDAKETRLAQTRIRKYEDLTREIDRLNDLAQQVGSITGNANEVSHFVSIVLETSKTKDRRFDHLPMSDYDFRNLVSPIVNKKIQELVKARDEV